MMIDPTARCPKWLIAPMKDRGGSISFYEYMDLVLNDPENGFYSTGRLKIGKDGDFCTSPSLSNDFARLLAIQVVDWLLERQLINNLHEQTLQGNTCLHIAALYNSVIIAKALLDAGAQSNITNQNNFTPLDFATHRSHTACIMLLSQNLS